MKQRLTGWLGLMLCALGLTIRPAETASLQYTARWPGIGRGPAEKAVARYGGRVFTACGPGGLVVVNATNPVRPWVEGAVATGGDALDLDVVGHYAYVACGAAGLDVINVTNPAAPQQVITLFYLTNNVLTVLCDATHAYLGLDRGIAVWSLANPALPVEQGRQGIQPSRRMAKSGQRLYVADGDDDLVIYDVSNPAAPNAISSISFAGGYPADVLVDGTTLYVACGSAGVLIYDVSDPLPARYLATVNYGHTVNALQKRGSFLFVARGEGVMTLNVSDPSHPTLLGDYVGDWIYSGLYLGDTEAYLCGGLHGLEIVDYYDPANITPAAVCDTSGEANGVDLLGQTVYLADGFGGLQVFSVTDKLQPRWRGGAYVPGGAWDVKATGNFAFVASGLSGMDVYNVTNPEAPTRVGGYNSPGSAWAVAVKDSHAYLADFGSLRVVNIALPNNPVEVGSYVPAGAPAVVDVKVSGSRAYLLDGTRTLAVLDISNPAAPSLMADTVYPWGDFRAIDVKGTVVYAANGNSQDLKIIDFATPGLPDILGTFAHTSVVLGVTVRDQYAYLSTRDAGVVMVDVSNPAAPAKVAEWSAGRWARQTAVGDGVVYAAQDIWGLTTLAIQGDLWADAVDLGGGWKWSSWLGYFIDVGQSWIWHKEHAWMYCYGMTKANVWFWTWDMAWLWSSDHHYPYLYRLSNDQWLWYKKDSIGPRWFYNLNTTLWESH